MGSILRPQTAGSPFTDAMKTGPGIPAGSTVTSLANSNTDPYAENHGSKR